ncbi:MAG: DUF2779 domain-containing protein [Candidatus Margulisiibacteriota bacterium]
MAKVVSKSKYLNGRQCLKLLWYYYNQKKDISPPDAATRSVMEEGKRVGEFAQKLFPDGIKVGWEYDPEEVNRKSLLAVQKRKPLFEAGFLYKEAYALADILVPAEEDLWDLIEVKSSTEVKKEHISDVAFQKYTYTGAGLKIRKCYVMYINRQYVRKGEIEADKLFNSKDISEDVEALLPNIESELAEMLKVIDEQEAPSVKIGSQCFNPHNCPLEDICWSFLPNDNIFLLNRLGRVGYDLLDRGILKISDIPADVELNERQLIQIDCLKTGKTHIVRENIKEFVDKLKYPLYFLDFETLAPAIPIYDDTRPYEEVPFQYSLHIVREKGGKPEHHPYLADGSVDPRPEVLRKLSEMLGESGTIVAYNAPYEINCLKRASDVYTDYKEWFEKTKDRFIDLLIPFKKYDYYNPAQEGSASMKSVLPALTGKNYNDLEIGNGNFARVEYMRAAFDKNTTKEEKDKIFHALEEYCELDTKGMIYILDVLVHEAEKG